jgi:hypothetical protein
MSTRSGELTPFSALRNKTCEYENRNANPSHIEQFKRSTLRRRFVSNQDRQYLCGAGKYFLEQI